MSSEQLNASEGDWVSVLEASAFMKICRASTYNLLNAGLIKTTSMKRPGTSRGRRLVSKASIVEFLNSNATGGQA
jgi:hypothetical protein